MGLIQASTDITDLKDDEQKFRYIKLFFDSCTQVVNGDLEFVKNIKTTLVSVSFTAANTNTSVSHGLGKVPSGYIIAGQTAAMSVYDGTGNSTSTTISLRSSAIGTARIIFF